MKVRVKYKTIQDMPPESMNLLSNVEMLRRIGCNTEFAPIGTEFVVYGMEIFEGNLMYYLANPPDESYPILCLAALFEIFDPTISQNWECGINGSGHFAIWPSSWFKISFYHVRLSDGDYDVAKDWQEIRQLFNAGK